MGFFRRVFVGGVIGAVIGFYVATSYLPVEMIDMPLAYTQLPVLGIEVHRHVALLTGLLGVIGAGFTAFLSA